ncbi:hypothetical protein [Solibacillus sp. FSL K6-4121]|uniref:hypothetical protein n=1 Tax=Solibacillus sp. FSL K6-4121 TaxID=2921505 RepID=UPI0030F965B1
MTLVRLNDIEGIDVSNLIFNEDVLRSFNSLNAKDLSKVITVLGTLNTHGLSYEHFRNRIEKLTGNHKQLYEVKVKSLAKKEWRFIVIPVKDDEGCVKIIVLHSFLKQSATIKEVDKNKALKVAKREELL